MRSPVQNLRGDNAPAAKAVRAQLGELGWSQAKLATKLGVTPNTVSRWLTGGLPVPTWLGEYLGALLLVKRLACQLELG